jgi:DNA-directed RNA polymerase subunit K/omega
MSYFEDDEKFDPKSDDEDDESTVQSDLDEDNDDEEEVVDNEVGEEVELGEDLEEEDDEDDEGEDDEGEDLEDAGEGKGGDDYGSDGEGNEANINATNLNATNLNATNLNKKVKKIIKKQVVNKAFIESLSDDDEDNDGETYLKKFDKDINSNYIVNNHPECALQNYDEILAMTKVVRDKNNIIIDDLHRTIPHLTKYERARILGQRAKQIECGATPFIKVPEDVIDGYLIASMELQQGRIPFIIRRPMPNGGSEYWKVSDLENIAF